VTIGIYKYVDEKVSVSLIYIPSFMKNGTGVQGILRFCFNNLKGFSVGITDGRDL
jgi:hypothetical protein